MDELSVSCDMLLELNQLILAMLPKKQTSMLHPLLDQQDSGINCSVKKALLESKPDSSVFRDLTGMSNSLHHRGIIAPQ